MSEISDLYHPIILEHSRSPRNYHSSLLASETIEAYNPLCGDQFRIHCHIERLKITQLSFSGYGCAVSKAATSVILEKIMGFEVSAASDLLAEYMRCVQGQGTLEDEELRVFQIAQQYPGRKQCAVLSAEVLFNFIRKKES